VTLPISTGLAFLQHRPGDRIKDRYDVLQRLGGGNFGSVYRVLDTAVGNVLACKEMHVLDNPDTPGDERAAALDLFKREALNLATLRHPNIPAAYFDQEDGHWQICPVCGLNAVNSEKCPEHGVALLPIHQRHYLMMDFVDGPTLEELITSEMTTRGRPLPEDRCLEWMHQIASALRTLHRVGIIHRDVKPDNIKIREADDQAVLLDFGLTKKVEEAGGYGTAPLTGTARFGTAGYAPENPRERESPERRSDIHALGMTLYRLLSGRDPQDERQLREMRDFSPRYFNREVSPDTEHLILVAIAPELSLRYQSIDDFLAELNEIRQPKSTRSSLPPFTFSDGAKARNATDLARLLESHHEEARNYLFNGMMGAWLLQNGFPAPANTGEQAVKVYANNPDRALELFRRSLYPMGTSHILPVLEVTPNALNFGSLDSGSRVEIKMRLRNIGPGLAWGRIEAEKKVQPGQTGLAAAVKGILAGGSGDEETKLPGLTIPDNFQGNDVSLLLELNTAKVPTGSYAAHLIIETDSGQYRVPVSYSVVPLELKAEPETLDFGAVTLGKKMEAFLAVVPANASIGKPRGTIYVGPSLSGLSAPERFEGSEPFLVTVDASSPNAVARPYDGSISLDTNGGRLRVPIRYRIILPPEAVFTLLAGGFAWGAVAGAAIRLLYYLVNPEYALKWLVVVSPSGLSLAPAESHSLGPLLAGAAAGLYGGWAWGGHLKKIPRAQRPSPFTDSDDSMLGTLPMFGLFFGSFGGYLTAQLLHYTLWNGGDWLLCPIAQHIPEELFHGVQDLAPFTWALAGGVGGLAWGVGRLMTAAGRSWGRYFAIVFAAAAFLMLLLNATMFTGS